MQEFYTWFSAARLPEVAALGLNCGHLQHAINSGAIKTVMTYRARIGTWKYRQYNPATAFTMEELRRFLASDECAKMLDALRNPKQHEKPKPKIHKKSRAEGIRRKLLELRAEAREVGLSFEDYLMTTGYTEEEIDELLHSRREDQEHPAESLLHDEEARGWEAGMAELQELDD